MAKTILVSLSIILLTSFTLEANPQSYTISSTSSQNLGQVTVSGSSCSASTTVSVAGNYEVDPGCTITSITIQGHVVNSPNTGPITLSNGASIGISWSVPNVVEIFDKLGTDSQQR